VIQKLYEKRLYGLLFYEFTFFINAAMYLKNPNALFFKWNYFFYLDRILETACVRKLGYNVKKLIREIFHIFLVSRMLY